MSIVGVINNAPQFAGIAAATGVTGPTPVVGTGVAPTDVSPVGLHQMFDAALLMSAAIFVLIVIAGISNSAGNAVIVILSMILLVQGITKVNPFVSWIAKHPLTPAQGSTTK